MRPALVMMRLISVCALVCSCCLIWGVGGASAVAADSGWEVHVSSQPTLISPLEGGHLAVLLDDRGGVATGESSPVVVTEQLPEGLVATSGNISAIPGGGSGSCEVRSGGSVLRCVYSGAIAGNAGEILEVVISVAVTNAAATSFITHTTVSGGDTPEAAVTKVVGVSETAPSSGLASFEIGTFGVDGRPDVQAGSHPNLFSVYLEFNSVNDVSKGGSGKLRPVQPVDDLVTDLPLGLIGDPQAAAKCPAFEIKEEDGADCPAGSIIGTLGFSSEFPEFGFTGNESISPVYNLEPQGGYAAEFAFDYLEFPGTIFGSVAHTSSGYVLRATVAGIPIRAGFKGALLTLFGDPGSQDHRGTPEVPFFTNPVSCDVPGTATVSMTNWGEPFAQPAEAADGFPAMTGCEKLHFKPQITAVPEVTQPDSPAGLAFGMRVPQNNEPTGLANSDLKDASVTLPAGMSISASSANGLRGCPATGPEGIEIGAEGVGTDTQKHLLQGHCPLASQIGKVKIVTPLLTSPVEGHLYFATPRCGGEGQGSCTEASATNGELYRVYLEAEGAGTVIKLEGRVAANPQTGQLTVTFDEAPEIPFSELQVTTDGGPYAPLATPQQCGSEYSATSDLTPWSTPQTPDATPSSPAFTVSGCSNGFSPTVSAGSTEDNAGISSPFTFTLSRQDGEGDLAGVSVTTPPGLTALLSEVTECEEAAAALGNCPESSKIGTTATSAGSGPDPFWLSGNVYLTGPYDGAPFGLAFVVPAKAGPINLGNVVVRAALNVNLLSGTATITTGAIPQIKDGVPFRLRTIRTTINRPGFMRNPTSCGVQDVTSTAVSAQGATTSTSTPYAVGGCDALPFKPVLTASTQGKTSKVDGASLDVKIAFPAGLQANIRSTKVDLPLAMPSRTTTLQQACPAQVFEANPAKCPEHSVIGIAKAVTPIFAVPLTGPVYLVSHASEAFPNAVIVLQGEGVRIDLVGDTDIVKGITSTTFKSVPDEPVNSFELYLPEGKYSQFAANGNFCTEKLLMPTVITGQNGAVIKQTTTITPTGCPKPKPTKKPKKAKAKKAADARARASKGGSR
jgi:hypothetical protein